MPIEHGNNGNEKRIGLRQVRVDGYIPSIDSVVEFQVCTFSLIIINDLVLKSIFDSVDTVGM